MYSSNSMVTLNRIGTLLEAKLPLSGQALQVTESPPNTENHQWETIWFWGSEVGPGARISNSLPREVDSTDLKKKILTST